VAALAAVPDSVIFKKLDRMAAFGAFGFKDGIRFPEAAVLSGAFHDRSSTKFLISQRLKLWKNFHEPDLQALEDPSTFEYRD
jgi:hypothetical protein